MSISLGVDIGSVYVKLVVIDSDSKIIHLDYEKITYGPRDAVISVISRLAEKYDLQTITRAG